MRLQCAISFESGERVCAKKPVRFGCANSRVGSSSQCNADSEVNMESVPVVRLPNPSSASLPVSAPMALKAPTRVLACKGHISSSRSSLRKLAVHGKVKDYNPLEINLRWWTSQSRLPVSTPPGWGGSDHSKQASTSQAPGAPNKCNRDRRQTLQKQGPKGMESA